MCDFQTSEANNLGLFRCSGKKGAVVRASAALNSEKVGELVVRTLVIAMGGATSGGASPTLRVRLAWPLKGWVSAKVLTAESFVDEWAGGTGWRAGETATTSSARWAAEEECAALGGFERGLRDYRCVRVAHGLKPKPKRLMTDWAIGAAAVVGSSFSCCMFFVGERWVSLSLSF